MKRRHLLSAAGLGLAACSPAGPLLAATPTPALAGTPTASATSAWQAHWQGQLAAIEQASGGRLGVSMRESASGEGLGWREHERFAMCSTFKWLLGAWVLALVDQGQASLGRRLHYAASDVLPYSPLSGPHAGASGMTVGELCAAAVSWSDNTAANVLLQAHGGPAALTAFVRAQGDSTTRLDRIEPELNAVASGDSRDTTSPAAMLHTLHRLVLAPTLSPPSRALLQHWLRDCRTGDHRLRAGAPGWTVGDKTGSWEPDGIANDVAVLWPPEPGGAPLLLTCYLSQARGPGSQRDAVLAAVARTAVAAYRARQALSLSSGQSRM